MSKTYILEPTAMEFVVSGHDYAHPHVTIQSGETGFISSTTVLNDGCFVDVAGTAYPFAMKDGDEYLFSPDISAENPQVFGIVLNDARTTYYGTFLTDGTTYEVSVYTEEEDSGDKPYIDEKLSKNVTYTDHPHNNWEAVLSKKGEPKTGYNTIEKIASSSSESGGSGGAGYSVEKVYTDIFSGHLDFTQESGLDIYTAAVPDPVTDLIDISNPPTAMVVTVDGTEYTLPYCGNYQMLFYGEVTSEGAPVCDEYPVVVGITSEDDIDIIAGVVSSTDNIETISIVAENSIIVPTDEFKKVVGDITGASTVNVTLVNNFTDISVLVRTGNNGALLAPQTEKTVSVMAGSVIICSQSSSTLDLGNVELSVTNPSSMHAYVMFADDTLTFVR